MARTGDSYRRNLPAAIAAVRKLQADGSDTEQVFVIMRALNGPTIQSTFARLMKSPNGPRLVDRRVELAARFSDPDFVASFAPGTLGAAYRAFLAETGYSAAGLAEVSAFEHDPQFDHPYAWLKRRTRDVHDVWHVLTGYQADEDLGEAALVAFSYAQMRGLGWAFIAMAAALKSLHVTRGTAFAGAVLEGYRRGRKARWLFGEDYELLMHEPIAAARARLGITPPHAYLAAQRALGAAVNITPAAAGSSPG